MAAKASRAALQVLPSLVRYNALRSPVPLATAYARLVGCFRLFSSQGDKGLEPSSRSNIPSFIVMDVMKAAHEEEKRVAREGGSRVLHLEVGQPSTGAPRRVVETARAAIGADRLGYTDALGIPQLRQRIAQSYRDNYGINVHPDRIMVTTGSSGAFLVAFTSLFDAGARVALAAPGYPCYRNILQALGCEPVLLDAGRATRFQPTVRMLEEAERSTGRPLDGLIVASPCNPTGTILAHEELKALCEYCDQRGIRLISDEIYHGIHFGAPAMTALRFSQRPMIINSFSKYYSMTGWRVGWIVAPEADSDWSQKLSTRLESLLQNFSICAPAVSQHAALEAFACGDELEGHRRRYARNAEILMDVLPRAGFSGLCPPDGAFYLYADIGDLTDDSLSFCRRMLVETGVAATPGVDFDPIKGRRFMRFSYAGSTEDIADAAERLVRWRGGKS